MSFKVKGVFAGRSVLITGGTGFLGKVLVEKILYSIPDVNKIFLLIRPSKGNAPRVRLDNILKVKAGKFFLLSSIGPFV